MRRMKQLLAMMAVLALGVGLCALPMTPVKVVAEERRGADDGKTLKIACIGDSLTEGTKGHSYTAYLKMMLGNNCEVRNFGYPGTSVTKGQGLSYIGSSYYTNSLAYKADVVIICIGGNDCQQNIWNVGTFQKDYEELIAAYQNQGNNPLVVAMTGGYCELPDGKTQMIWGHSDQLIENHVQPAQNAAADKLGVPRADLRAVVKPNADAYIDGEDGVHYTAAGYQAMAQLAYDLISPRIDIPGGATTGMIDPTNLNVPIGEYDGFRALMWEKGQKGSFAYNAGGLAFALGIEAGTVVDNLTLKVSYFWDYHAGGNDWWHFNTTDKDGLSAPSWDGGNPHDNGFGLFSQYGLKQNQWDVLTVSRDEQMLGGTGTDWSVSVGDLNAANSLYIRGFEVTATLADGTVKKATWGVMRGRRGADDGKTLKIACVGDSLTEGTKGFSYVKNLQAMLGGSCEVRNFGYPGTSVTKGQGLSYIGSSYYTNSLAYKADVVIICIGGNDCQQNIWNVGTFQKDYEELIAAYQNQGNDPLVVAMTGGYCELPDGKNQMIWGHSDQLIEQKVQPAQNAAADKLGVPRADLRAVIKPNADAYIDGDDGVHYTAAGYQAMAQLAYDLLVPLVEFPADRGALRDALADEITFFDGFTKDSVAAYKAALEKAKAVMDDAEATQEEIDAAAAALVAAFQGLTVAGTPGDVDGDEEITSTDARLTLQYYAGKIGEEDLDVEAADVDGDGTITSTDARLILQKYAGKIEDFPI